MNTQVLCDECTEKVKFYYCVNTKFYYCAHCDFKSNYKMNIKIHIERKHAHKEMIICCNNEKSHMEFIPVDEKDDLMEDSIEVWKIYQLLLKMKNK